MFSSSSASQWFDIFVAVVVVDAHSFLSFLRSTYQCFCASRMRKTYGWLSIFVCCCFCCCWERMCEHARCVVLRFCRPSFQQPCWCSFVVAVAAFVVVVVDTVDSFSFSLSHTLTSNTNIYTQDCHKDNSGIDNDWKSVTDSVTWRSRRRKRMRTRRRTKGA